MGDNRVIDGDICSTTMRAEERATQNAIQHDGIPAISPVSSLEDTNNFSGESASDALRFADMERDRTINNKEVLTNNNRHKMYERHAIIYQLKGKKVLVFNPVTSDLYQTNHSPLDGYIEDEELEEYESETVPTWIENMIPIQCSDPRIILDFKYGDSMLRKDALVCPPMKYLTKMKQLEKSQLVVTYNSFIKHRCLLSENSQDITGSSDITKQPGI